MPTDDWRSALPVGELLPAGSRRTSRFTGVGAVASGRICRGTGGANGLATLWRSSLAATLGAEVGVADASTVGAGAGVPTPPPVVVGEVPIAAASDVPGVTVAAGLTAAPRASDAAGSRSAVDSGGAVDLRTTAGFG